MDLTEILELTAKVGAGAVAALSKGVIGTASDCASAVSCAARQDWDAVGDIVSRRVSSAVHAGMASVDAAVELAGSASECLRDGDREFLTEENTRRMTQLAATALVLWAAGSMLDDAGPGGDMPDITGMRGR